MQHAWTVESEDVLVLAHPAWRGLKHNTVSPASYTEHTIQVDILPLTSVSQY